jgi:SAM-dependent methyltransferase
MPLEISDHNRTAWDRQVEQGNRWTVPVSSREIEAARGGDWAVLLTPRKPVPRDWFPAMEGVRVLCLASGGGQQGPIFAAVGARVWVFDNSARQLEQDRVVAEREGLALETVQGDMADLSSFDDGSFDLVFHPVSNCFVPDVFPVWREVHRVLRGGGLLLAGFANPVLYLFDDDDAGTEHELTVKRSIPYSDAHSLSAHDRRQYERDGLPLEFGHTLEDQIGGQLRAGFVLLGMYEDSHHLDDVAISHHIPTFMATRALKPIPGPESA